MESAEITANNVFLSYLMDCFGSPKTEEISKGFATIDGDYISEGAMHSALKAGKGLLVGGFFVSAFSNDMN